MAKKLPLQLLNAKEATFECTFGRGCEGVCCKNGRPGLHAEEYRRIESNLSKFLEHLRPRARAVIEQGGIVTRRFRSGLPLVPVVDGWCVFFNQGCVLHKVGAAEGDSYQYKPIQCALFPLLQDDDGQWFVRQAGYKNEVWNDLFCLSPSNSKVPAVQSLRDEMDLAQHRYGD
jgi:Fe-S-cluster containining protein